MNQLYTSIYTYQDRESGRFIDTPEYPEFPWYEGIINAVAHRDYAASGQYIKVSMFDNRLEIESPGRFPDLVTADNISYTRFSRNKAISRVMTEFEWVRELNEGVKKIYADMASAGLPAPEYVETPNTVKLILRNNIDERTAHRKNKASNGALNDALNGALPMENRQNIGETSVEHRYKIGDTSVKQPGIGDVDMNTTQYKIAELLKADPSMTGAALSERIGISKRNIESNIKKMKELGVLVRQGSSKGGYWEVRM